jgi:hypothetical protein
MARNLQIIALAMLPAVSSVGAPPSGFSRTVLNGDYSEIIGITPLGDGRSLAFERNGVVWILSEDGEASEEPFLDISEEVLPWRDHGFMSLVVDPEFLSNGLVYVLYVVDPHHLHLFGSPDYDPNETWESMASIGRVTRYEATSESAFALVDPSTRYVLIGESIDKGIPILHQSHGLGSIFFGSDGSLLLSMGDSAAYNTVDTGGQVPGGWISEALDDGIISESEDLGAFRAQSVNSLCGKILRIDAATGDGLSSNPFFDATAPRAARSRVWALGLRNPFRCSHIAGTGSTSPEAGDPGSIAYSDVGWHTREESGIITSPKENLGWPLFEGFDTNASYWFADAANPDAPNPLADSICDEFLLFRDLIQEERPDGPLFSNPCDALWTEAEDAESDNMILNQTVPGSTGIGSLEFDGGTEWIEVEINGEGKMPIEMGIRYSLLGEVPMELAISIDGTFLENAILEPSGCATCWRVHTFHLTLDEGTHDMRFTGTSVENLLVDRIEMPSSDGTPLPKDMLVFLHSRPLVDWHHSNTELARVDSSLDGNPVAVRLTADDCPVEGTSFGGVCATGVEAIFDPRWPKEYHGVYFADFYYQWLRVLYFDENSTLTHIKQFDLQAGKIADLTFDPISGDLLVTTWDQFPIRYSPPKIDCPADLDGSGAVNGADLGLLLASWNTINGDLNHDGTTNGADIGLMLAAWGACTP